MKQHLEKAIRLFGTQARLADAIGCSQQQISWLLNQGKKISPEVAVAIEKATRKKVTRRQLRPDLW